MSNYPPQENVNRNFTSITSSAFSGPMGSNESSRQYGLPLPSQQGGRRRRRTFRKKPKRRRGKGSRFATRSNKRRLYRGGACIQSAYSSAGVNLNYKNSALANPIPFQKIY